MTDASPRAVQERLRALGYYDGKIDGVIGPVTLAAMQRALATAAMNLISALTAETLEIFAAGRVAIVSRGNNLIVHKK